MTEINYAPKTEQDIKKAGNGHHERSCSVCSCLSDT